jgi:hypothetical protein
MLDGDTGPNAQRRYKAELRVKRNAVSNMTNSAKNNTKKQRGKPERRSETCEQLATGGERCLTPSRETVEKCRERNRSIKILKREPLAGRLRILKSHQKLERR